MISGFRLVISALAQVIRKIGYPNTPLSDPKGKVLWMINHYAVTEDMPGGTRHLDIAKLLIPHGWKTVIFASAFNHNSHTVERRGKLPWMVSKEQIDGVNFVWVPTTPYTRNDWRRYLNMLVFTVQLIVRIPFQLKPDIVLGSSAHLLAGFAAYVASRVFRVPFILEIRDVWPDSLIQLGLDNSLVIQGLRVLEKALYKRAALIIAVSEGIAQRVIEKGVPPEKVQVIAHGLRETEAPTPEERRQARARMGWDDKVVAIWAGSLQPFNGLDVVVEAARILEDEQDLLIVFVGDGSERDTLARQARGLQNVRLYPSVPKTEIRTWLASADIGLLNARRFDAFLGVRPRKIFDYFSMALPIICTIPGEAWEVISDANAGVFTEWEDPAGLAEVLRQLVRDEKLRTALGWNGRSALEDKHSLTHSAASLASSLERLSP